MLPTISNEEYDYAIQNRTCFCGSRLPRHELRDARNIFCCYVCDKCETERRKEFRSDIFTDSNYWADEPIDEE